MIRQLKHRKVAVVFLRFFFFIMMLGVLPLLADDYPVARQLLDQGRVDDALVMLRTQIHGSPQNPEAHNLLCRAYLSINQWDPAIAACERAVRLDPTNSGYHLWLARSYGQKAEHTGAFAAARLAINVRNELETAVRLNPGSIDARSDLADFYLEAPWVLGGGPDKAEGQAQELAKLELAQADLVRARIAEKKKNFAAAESEYHRAIEHSGGAAGPWLALARFCRRAFRFDDMEEAIGHATAPQLNRPDVLISAAEILMQSGHNPAGAARLLERYLSSPTPVEDAPVFEAHYLLGTLFERQGQPQKARAQYQAALTLASNFAPARSALERLGARASSELAP
jgi:cytochrome c-type biogenesis protein CcmH/NrfG